MNWESDSACNGRNAICLSSCAAIPGSLIFICTGIVSLFKDVHLIHNEWGLTPWTTNKTIASTKTVSTETLLTSSMSSFILGTVLIVFGVIKICIILTLPCALMKGRQIDQKLKGVVAIATGLATLVEVGIAAGIIVYQNNYTKSDLPYKLVVPVIGGSLIAFDCLFILVSCFFPKLFITHNVKVTFTYETDS